jgi:arsenate reductase (glutaredoxin)
MNVPDVHHEVVRVALEMEAAGLVVGTAGNVSGRRPDGSICLTPSSTPYRDITADALAVVDLDGQHVQGTGRPSTEKAMHLACYRQFPEVGGVVHCHPLHASMFAVAHQQVPPAVEEALVYIGGSIPVARYAMTGSDELAAEVVLYLKTPPDADTLRSIISKLEDPVTDLVRRDSMWTKLGLTDADAATDEQVVALLVKHKQLLQRPVVVTATKAIVGRPKERVRALLGG